ncbi:unnamed protein product [Spirodela intermedia]|uniref:Uncharacterized protein n=1 Tax=Spirodela intermedia TaxID=51605 RepID=A0A7I8IXL4_SPIIN|nr:unnamed protein product [Spirodela intermedia]CAA6662746.1 unnamed protein product [Spirodela intermedia]
MLIRPVCWLQGLWFQGVNYFQGH